MSYYTAVLSQLVENVFVFTVRVLLVH